MDRLKRKKWNARELFLMIYEKLEKEGLVPENILDYSCAGSASELIQSEEFDIVPHIVHGASEGIYMDIRLEAQLDGIRYHSLPQCRGNDREDVDA